VAWQATQDNWLETDWQLGPEEMCVSGNILQQQKFGRSILAWIFFLLFFTLKNVLSTCKENLSGKNLKVQNKTCRVAVIF